MESIPGPTLGAKPEWEHSANTQPVRLLQNKRTSFCFFLKNERSKSTRPTGVGFYNSKLYAEILPVLVRFFAESGEQLIRSSKVE